MTNVSFSENRAIGEGCYRFTHKSGLTVYLVPKPFITDYAVLSVNFGSMHRTFSIQGKSYTAPSGVAHFLEHQLFTMPDGKDAFEMFAALGANANAYTTYSRTSYLFSCTAHFSESLEILLRMVTTPVFSEVGMRREREIIRQEIRAGDDQAPSRLYRSVMGSLFEQHAVREAICGTEKSIADITPEWLYLCHKSFYTPERMVLSLSGKMTLKEVTAVLDKVFAEETERAALCVTLPEADRFPVPRAKEDWRMAVAKPVLEIGIKDRAFPIDAESMSVRHILADMTLNAFFGQESLLFESLQKRGLLHDGFSADYADEVGCAYILIAAETASPEIVIDEVKRTLVEGCQKPPSQDVFERLKRCAYADYVRLFDSTEEIAEEILDDYFTGVPLLDVGDSILGITYEEWVSFIREVFWVENCTVSIVRPLDVSDAK